MNEYIICRFLSINKVAVHKMYYIITLHEVTRLVDAFNFQRLHIKKEKKSSCFKYGFQHINYDFLKIYFAIIVHKVCVIYYLK